MEKWNMSPASKDSLEIDIAPDIETLVSSLMCKTVVTGQFTEETKRIYQLRITVRQQSAKLIKFMFFPGWWHLPFQEVKVMKAAHRETQSLVKKMVIRRLEEMKNGARNEGDVLSLMLEAYQDEASGVSLDDVIEVCRSFHFVGPESTTRSQIWMMYLLAKHPEWQERARQEVLQVFGEKKPNVQGLYKLKTVTMIMYEALRLYPPTVIFHRSISKDTKLGDMVLPAWIQISIPLILMHHDPDIWGEDATQFNPERFAEGGSFNSRMQLLTFTWGPKKCTGESMAVVIHKTLIATLLQGFSFQLSPSYLHAPKHVFLLAPEHGMKLLVRKFV
ncbi:cytochrome P450 72A397-like [Apium graveolens]|uniref:cytochrome P450 72A397-like n=1 Tax=Apium graveolens TaxID=4045 RepID=UPI003D79F20D